MTHELTGVDLYNIWHHKLTGSVNIYCIDIIKASAYDSHNCKHARWLVPGNPEINPGYIKAYIKCLIKLNHDY